MNINFLPQFFSRLFGKDNRYYPFGWDFLNASTAFNTLSRDKEKIAAILSNPAALKVFALQCDLFSLGKPFVYQDDKPLENDEFLSLLRSPNMFQTENQFLWDFMFWTMLGTDYCYVDSKVLGKKNKMYHLDPSKMYWPYEIEKWKDKMVLSDEYEKKIKKLEITYCYDDGTKVKIPLEKIIISTDLTNGLGNWFKGPSRVDALYKVISNAEYTLDAFNINIRYAGKFLVGGKVDAQKGATFSEEERTDLITKLESERKVFPYKTGVEIRRFVENFANLQLDGIYMQQYYIIGSMYGIPREVLEAYNEGSTYENQEKARAAHVTYCFEPKGNQFMDAFERYFGYDKKGKNIYLDWSHLSAMQAFEKEKAEVSKIKVETLSSLLQMGVDIKQINEFLDTDFKIKKPKNEQQGQQGGNQSGQTEEGQGAEGEQND